MNPLAWGNKLVENFLIQVVAPATAGFGKGWKTVIGLCLLGVAAACQEFLSGRGLSPDTMEWVNWLLDWAERIGYLVFGIGVYHKVAASDPRAISGAAKP